MTNKRKNDINLTDDICKAQYLRQKDFALYRENLERYIVILDL